MLKDKNSYPAVAMYLTIEKSIDKRQKKEMRSMPPSM
jgi:hypothetical protein